MLNTQKRSMSKANHVLNCLLAKSDAGLDTWLTAAGTASPPEIGLTAPRGCVARRCGNILLFLVVYIVNTSSQAFIQ